MLTRSITDGRVERRPENADIKRLVGCGQAFDMLEVAECGDS